MAKSDMSGWITYGVIAVGAYALYEYLKGQCAASPAPTGFVGSLCSSFYGTPTAASVSNSIPSLTTLMPSPSSSTPVATSGPSADPYAAAIAHLKTAAGGNSEDYDQWAWYWENSGTFAGAPNGFGVTGAVTNPSVMAQIIQVGGGGNAANNWAGRTSDITAEQFVSDMKQAQGLSGLTPYAEIGIPAWMIHGGYNA